MFEPEENTVETVAEETEPKDSSKVAIKRDFCPHRRVSYRICKNCGQMYVLTDNDTVYYVQNYGTIPLKCPKCREKSKTDTAEKQ